MRPLRGSTVPIAAFTLQRQIPSGCTLLGNIKPSWRQSNKDIPAPFLPTFCQLKVVKLKLWRAWNCQMEGRHFDPNGKSTLCFHISGEIFSTFRASRLFFGAQHFLTGGMGEGGGATFVLFTLQFRCCCQCQFVMHIAQMQIRDGQWPCQCRSKWSISVIASETISNWPIDHL